jgi:hypothetical protein
MIYQILALQVFVKDYTGAQLLLAIRILTTNSESNSVEGINDLRNDILKTSHKKLHFNDMA